jgi:hypothetical protein
MVNQITGTVPSEGRKRLKRASRPKANTVYPKIYLAISTDYRQNSGTFNVLLRQRRLTILLTD